MLSTLFVCWKTVWLATYFVSRSLEKTLWKNDSVLLSWSNRGQGMLTDCKMTFSKMFSFEYLCCPRCTHCYYHHVAELTPLMKICQRHLKVRNFPPFRRHFLKMWWSIWRWIAVRMMIPWYASMVSTAKVMFSRILICWNDEVFLCELCMHYARHTYWKPVSLFGKNFLW